MTDEDAQRLAGFYIITRMGLGVRNPEFYRGHSEIASLTVIPSLRAQSDQEFIWIVCVDKRAPKWVDTKLRYLAQGLHIEVWRIDPLKSGLSPSRHILKWQQETKGRRYIARIDDDDLVHRDFVRDAKIALNEETTSAALTFPIGINLTARSSRVTRYPWIGLGLTTFSPDGSLNPYTHQHNKITERARDIKTIVMDTTYPMWIRTWRGTSVSSEARGIRADGEDCTYDRSSFGLGWIGSVKLRRYLERAADAPLQYIGRRADTVLAMKRRALQLHQEAIARKDKREANLMAQIFYRL